jgi:hypothetical protein
LTVDVVFVDEGSPGDHVLNQETKSSATFFVERNTVVKGAPARTAHFDVAVGLLKPAAQTSTPDYQTKSLDSYP